MDHRVVSPTGLLLLRHVTTAHCIQGVARGGAGAAYCVTTKGKNETWTGKSTNKIRPFLPFGRKEGNFFGVPQPDKKTRHRWQIASDPKGYSR
jgi:hypothetical protein